MKHTQTRLGDRYVRCSDYYGIMVSLYKEEVRKYKATLKDEVKK